jgi:hypothetical protein
MLNHHDKNNNGQKMMTTQQSTWTSVLCSYKWQENDVEWSFMAHGSMIQLHNATMAYGTKA